MGRLELTLREMLTTIKDGAGKIREELETGDNKKAEEACSEIIEFTVHSEGWALELSRCGIEVRSFMEKIAREINSLKGLLDNLLCYFNEADMQRATKKLNDIVQDLGDFQRALSNANNQDNQKP